MKQVKQILLPICLLCLTSCNKSQIKMTFEGFSNDTVIVYSISFEDAIKATDDSAMSLDTLLIKDQRIDIPVADKDMMYIFQFCETDNGDPRYTHRSIEIETRPEDRLTYKVKRTAQQFEYTAKGNAYVKGKAAYERYILPIANEIDQYDRLIDENWVILDSLYEERRKRAADWLRNNLDNPAAVYVLGLEVASDTLLAYYNQLQPLINESVLKEAVEQRRDQAERYVATMRAKEIVKEGAEAPQFTLENSCGEPISLITLQDKWVVLDFWGTWCGWCIKGIPEMKEAYEKHKDKCEFVSIDCAESRDAWLEGLGKYQLPWINLYNPTDSSPLEDVSVMYAVKDYPTKIIITPNGLIHKIYIGESAEFYAELDKIVK